MTAAHLDYRTVEANGLAFNVATAGDGDHLALCLHGAPELSYSWRHQLPVLAAAGYRAWAPDLRGYGGTTRPPRTADYAIERLLDDVAALIDVSGARTTTLIAHDWGGIIAWWFALRQVRPLERLVVMNLPHPAIAERAMLRSPLQLLRSSYIVYFQLPWLPERQLAMRRAEPIVRSFTAMAVNKDRFDEADLDVYRQAALEPGALKAIVDYYRAYVRGGGQRRQARLGYPVITTPTLLVWGERDAALGKELSEGTDAYVEDLTVRYIPEASHWVQQDAPEVVNAMLTAFLAGQPVPEASEVHPP